MSYKNWSPDSQPLTKAQVMQGYRMTGLGGQLLETPESMPLPANGMYEKCPFRFRKEYEDSHLYIHKKHHSGLENVNKFILRQHFFSEK